MRRLLSLPILIVSLAFAILSVQGCQNSEEAAEKPKGQMPPIQEPTAQQIADRTKMLNRDK